MVQDQPRHASGVVSLRDVEPGDVEIFFEHQRHDESNRMAAFPARDRDAHFAHWRKILADDSCVTKTVLFDGVVAGNVLSWDDGAHREVGYWIDSACWGKGIATRALTQLLELVTQRPLTAAVAEHNRGSLRVLEKCGFRRTGAEEGEDGVVLVLLELDA